MRIKILVFTSLFLLLVGCERAQSPASHETEISTESVETTAADISVSETTDVPLPIEPETESPPSFEASVTDTETVPSSDTESVTEAETETETEAPETYGPSRPGRDFASLQKNNPDVYAWIEIPGTTLSYPLVQHPEDNAYYLKHNVEKKYDIYGAIFTEDYNSTDLEDPVTVIYGHTARSGAMFGMLQRSYSSSKFFSENSVIRVSTPETEYNYKIFAAVPFSNLHILYYYDFSYEYTYTSFFAEIMRTRSLDANLDSENAPIFGEKVLILSTCLDGNSAKRYLVMAKRVES